MSGLLPSNKSENTVKGENKVGSENKGGSNIGKSGSLDEGEVVRDGIVIFNVGGTKFQVTMSTLANYKSGLLYKICQK